MNKKNLIISILPILLLTSCVNNNINQNDNEITVTDGIGRKVTLNPNNINNIICVGAGALRYYTYLEGSQRLKGVEDIDNPSMRSSSSPFNEVARPYYDAYKDEFNGLISVGQGGPMHQSPELEKIISASPDLIISDYETEESASLMENASNAKVFTVKYGSKGIFDDNFISTIESLGKLLNKEARSKELIDYVNSSKEEIINLTKDDNKDINVYIGGIGNWGQKDYLSTNPNYYPFDVSNINNCLKDSSLSYQGVQNIDKEKFYSLSKDIDVMILDCAGISKTIEAYNLDNSIFDEVTAIKNNEVYIALPFNAYYQNLEIDLINTYYYASIIHKDVFGSDFNIEEKADEILNKFLNKKIYSSLKEMKGQYGGYHKIDNFYDFLKNGK